MLSRGIAILAIAWLALFAQSAQAFFDPPWITPEHPAAGETVMVNIHYGVCDAIFGEEGYPQITQEGSAIRMRWFGQHWPEGSSSLCIYPISTFVTPLGVYPAGSYTLTIELAYYDYFDGPSIRTIGVVPFTVAAAAAPAAPVPAVGWVGAAILVMLLLGLSLWKRPTRRAAWLVLVLACTPLGVRAQEKTIRVLLSKSPGAPTPAAVLAWVNSSPRASKPPLGAFSTVNPLGGDYLIPDRASGDFLAWLNANPHSVRKRLEDYLLVKFPDLDIPAALSALQADPYVAVASEPPPYTFSSVGLVDFVVVPDYGSLGGNDQYGYFAMNIDAAWRLAGGYALVAQLDMGLYKNHPALRQWSTTTTYAGGNFVETASRDVGLTGRTVPLGFDELDVDEMKQSHISDLNCANPAGLRPPTNTGHGTHAAGLIGANSTGGVDVQGTCKHCGIQMYKMTYLSCFVGPPPKIVPTVNANGSHRAKAQAVDTGAQVLSMSFGAAYDGLDRCGAYRLFPECLTLSYGTSRDLAMVAASGNQRRDLEFPASDKRVISAGGFRENLSLWDEFPTCPPTALSECGSNWTKLHGNYYYTHQEVLASAKHVLSTTYPNTTWVDYAECGDGYGTPMGDGVGWCTGTSMSAPQVAGMFGLLRSINPLAPAGVPEPAAGAKPGLRTVVAQTGARARLGLGWDPKVGYGIPDAAAAASRVLGKVAGVTARNRATPLFRLWDSFSKDFAETTSPQYALSLMITQVHNYVQPTSGLGAGPTVTDYTFPYDPDDLNEPDDSIDPYEAPPAVPRAAIYVLTTEFRPRTEWPELRPLHLMDKAVGGGKDYLLATTKAEIETAHAAGYALRTIQGYIYQPCTPEPACIPPVAEKLWRQYKAADSDCAVFLESERNAFETAGYTAACPTGATKMIGYAYPATDSDVDGLPDGFEQVAGTNPNAVDSDGDGSLDATEYPLYGIPTGDPCMDGPLGARNCGGDHIFKNGFEQN